MSLQTNLSTTTTANNTTGSTGGGGVGSGGAGRGGGDGLVPNVPSVPDSIELAPDFPSGWGLLSNAIAGFVKSFANGVGGLVDQFHYNLLTLPAAGNPLEPNTWMSFNDPFWLAVATVYGMLSAFVLPIVWGIGWFNVGYTRGMTRRDRVKKLMWALFLIIAGWELLQFWFHFWNEAALAFAPMSEAFLATPGNTAKLGVGLILGAFLLFTNAIIILAGLFIHLLFVLLTFLFVALWPLSVGLYLSDMFTLEAIGNSGIMATLLLSPLQFAKAVVLRLVFEFPLNFKNPETVVTFLLIVVGVTVAFVGLPYFGLKRLIPRSIVATGGRLGRSGDRQERMQKLRDRTPSGSDLRDRVVSVSSSAKSRLSNRGGGSESSLQSRSRSTDSTPSRWSRTSMSRGAGGTDTRSRTANRGNTRSNSGD